MSDAIDNILTVKEVAEYLRVNQRTVYRLAVGRTLPGFKVGATWRFKRSDIDEWIRAQATDGPRSHQDGQELKKSKRTKREQK